MSGIVFEQDQDLLSAVSDATGSSGNIVLICSEPGEGHNRQMAYPFSYPQVVSIASATAYGKEGRLKLSP
jgi:hypothetical protein